MPRQRSTFASTPNSPRPPTASSRGRDAPPSAPRPRCAAICARPLRSRPLPRSLPRRSISLIARPIYLRPRRLGCSPCARSSSTPRASGSSSATPMTPARSAASQRCSSTVCSPPSPRPPPIRTRPRRPRRPPTSGRCSERSTARPHCCPPANYPPSCATRPPHWPRSNPSFRAMRRSSRPRSNDWSPRASRATLANCRARSRLPNRCRRHRSSASTRRRPRHCCSRYGGRDVGVGF